MGDAKPGRARWLLAAALALTVGLGTPSPGPRGAPGRVLDPPGGAAPVAVPDPLRRKVPPARVRLEFRLSPVPRRDPELTIIDVDTELEIDCSVREAEFIVMGVDHPFGQTQPGPRHGSVVRFHRDGPDTELFEIGSTTHPALEDRRVLVVRPGRPREGLLPRWILEKEPRTK
jgi:hypothetical protein